MFPISSKLMSFICISLPSRCISVSMWHFTLQGSQLSVKCHPLVCVHSFIRNETRGGGMSVPIHFCWKVGSFKWQPVCFPVSLHGSARWPARGPSQLTAHSILTGLPSTLRPRAFSYLCNLKNCLVVHSR